MRRQFMRSKKIISAVLIAALAVVITGCAGRSPAKKNGFTIVTSFYPMYISALNVAGGVKGVSVVDMTKPSTGCLHDYQFTTGDLTTLESASAFVINGAGMETFMDKVVAQLPKLKVVNATTGIKLIKDADGEDNPHVWVSVTDDITQVQNIAKGLEADDPAHAAAYRANAAAYVAKLQSLRTDMHAALDNVKIRDIITFHEAFPYFAQEFNLKIDAVIERDPGTAPTPLQLAQTIDIVKKTGCDALFAEPQYPQDAANAIAAETGAKIYSLDPAVSGPETPGAYINIMRLNLKTLKEALD
jgi:zinc transport system substrate-binding protein